MGAASFGGAEQAGLCPRFPAIAPGRFALQ